MIQNIQNGYWPCKGRALEGTQNTKKSSRAGAFLCVLCARGGGRTRTAVRPQNFKSCVATNYTTRACVVGSWSLRDLYRLSIFFLTSKYLATSSTPTREACASHWTHYKNHWWVFIMSPGWELNPRMSVLQTEALTTSPPGQYNTIHRNILCALQ